MAIYLDYNASSPVDERVLQEMINVYKNIYGNPDSRTHNHGDNARQKVEKARYQVAKLLSVEKDCIIFTSGATESNNIALLGLKDYAEKTGKKHIITSSIEHKSILEAAKQLQKEGFKIDFVKPNIDGIINIDEIVGLINENTLLVSIMHVNNETGIIQPIEELGNILSEKGILFHVDATQSCGKLVPEIKKLKYDMLSFSSHKLRGPQGVGVLVLKKKNYQYPPIKPIMFGGQQENKIRPGTVPTALVVGLGKACEIAENEYFDNLKKYKLNKEIIMNALEASGLKYKINGKNDLCFPNTLNLCIEGIESEALMISGRDFCSISNGSACNSKEYRGSYVLAEMGLSDDIIASSVRLSWGAETDSNELKKQVENLLNAAKQFIF